MRALSNTTAGGAVAFQLLAFIAVSLALLAGMALLADQVPWWILYCIHKASCGLIT